MKAIILLVLSTLSSTLLAQQPPPVWYTNFFHMEVRYATDGAHFTNVAIWNGYPVATDRENDSTNEPWANGFDHVPFNDIFYEWTGYPTNKVICYWTWNLNRFDTNNFTYNGKTYNMATNWLQVTNDPDTCCGTVISFSPYAPLVNGPTIGEEFEVKAPTNIDPGATLIWSYLLVTNKWHVNANPQYYGSSVNFGQSFGPNYWRSSNSVHDPAIRIRWYESGQWTVKFQSTNW